METTTSLTTRVSSVFSTTAKTVINSVHEFFRHPLLHQPRADNTTFTPTAPSCRSKIIHIFNSLLPPKINAPYVPLFALGSLFGCDGGAVSVPMFVEMAAGGGIVVSAGMLAYAILGEDKGRINQINRQIEQLNEIETKAKDPQELANTMKKHPDVTITILKDIAAEISKKLENCSQTKIDWDSVIEVCDDLLNEMSELGITSDQEGYRKILGLKAQAKTEIQELAEAANNLIAQAEKVPSWIEDQKIKMQQLHDQHAIEQRIARIQRRVTGLVGKVADLKTRTSENVAEAEKLTAEIVATQELLQRVDALTEVEAYLALPLIRALPPEKLSDLREKVALKRKELQTGASP